MQNFWADERRRIIILLLFGLAAGVITGYWTWVIIGLLLVYLCWQIWHLRQLLFWLEHQRAKIRNLPKINGVWELIAQRVYRIQQRSRQQKKRLRNVLARFERIAAAMPDATILLAKNHTITWSNQIAFDLLGIRYPDDKGQRLDNLIRDPALRDYLAQLKHNNTANTSINISSPLSKQIELNIRIIEFERNEYLLIARDISELVRVQTMRKQFIADVSHELRTPLTVIHGYIETLLEEELDAEQHTALQTTHEQVNRMQDIVESLLELSRLETHTTNTNRSAINLQTLIASSQQNFQQLADKSGHELTFELMDEIILYANEKELYSLFSNLIYNALRHTPGGTKIKVSWQYNSQQQPELRVKDNGPGIAPEHIPHITERFYRVDPGRARSKGGSGLGLAIVKHIMQRYNGQLQINSTVGVGTEIICTFPSNYRKTPSADSA